MAESFFAVMVILYFLIMLSGKKRPKKDLIDFTGQFIVFVVISFIVLASVEKLLLY